MQTYEKVKENAIPPNSYKNASLLQIIKGIEKDLINLGKKKTAYYQKYLFTYYWLPVKAKTTARERYQVVYERKRNKFFVLQQGFFIINRERNIYHSKKLTMAKTAH